MELYGMGKSRSFRALWALEEAGVDYEYIAVEFASNNKNGAQSDSYKALNPQGKVPTLVDDSLVLTESGAILNYIASCSPKMELIPSDNVKRRAKYDEICCFILTELEQGLWTNGKHRFALPVERRVPDVLATADWEFNKAIIALEQLFDGEGYLMGDVFTMADVLLAHTLNWAENFKFAVPDKLLTYKNKMYYRAACKKALSQVEQLE